MKLIYKPLCGLFAVAAVAVVIFSVSRISWGREGAPVFNISATPINRDARLGTSFAPIASPSPMPNWVVLPQPI